MNGRFRQTMRDIVQWYVEVVGVYTLDADGLPVLVRTLVEESTSPRASIGSPSLVSSVWVEDVGTPTAAPDTDTLLVAVASLLLAPVVVLQPDGSVAVSGTTMDGTRVAVVLPAPVQQPTGKTDAEIAQELADAMVIRQATGDQATAEARATAAETQALDLAAQVAADQAAIAEAEAEAARLAAQVVADQAAIAAAEAQATDLAAQVAADQITIAALQAEIDRLRAAQVVVADGAAAAADAAALVDRATALLFPRDPA